MVQVPKRTAGLAEKVCVYLRRSQNLMALCLHAFCEDCRQLQAAPTPATKHNAELGSQHYRILYDKGYYV